MKKQGFSQEIITRLIRAHLINKKLVSGLTALGLNADDYHLYLVDAIFLLMGFEDNKHTDLIVENVFWANSEKVKHINFAYDMKELDALSKEIYEELVWARSLTHSETDIE